MGVDREGNSWVGQEKRRGEEGKREKVEYSK